MVWYNISVFLLFLFEIVAYACFYYIFAIMPCKQIRFLTTFIINMYDNHVMLSFGLVFDDILYQQAMLKLFLCQELQLNFCRILKIIYRDIETDRFLLTLTDTVHAWLLPEFCQYSIELSGKFMLILKENWNAEDLNFSIPYIY